MKTIPKSVLATGAAALLLSLATASIAQAGPKGPNNFKNFQGMKMGQSGHHRHWRGFGPTIVIGNGYDSYYSYGSYGCGYYQRMFWNTGNYYWKAKYYDCLY